MTPNPSPARLAFSPARACALTVLRDVSERGAYANISLRQALADKRLQRRDRALVTEIVNETLRNRLRIDHIVDSHSRVPIERMKPFIRSLLRMSVCQLYFLSKIPPSAAINESVNMAKVYGFVTLAGFVNGVLRAILSEMPDAAAEADIALRYSYPPWLYERLGRWLGQTDADAFCADSHQPPSVTVYVNTLKTTPAALALRLQAEGVDSEPGLLPACLTLRRASNIAALPSFNAGLFFVMDEGAALAVDALGLTPGQRLVDMCAAPGGKSFAAACVMGGQGRVQAYDLHTHRVRLMRESLARMGFDCIDAQKQDMNLPVSELADAVLLDAPCSGLGILRRRPEIKYTRRPEDIAALAETQRGLLVAAAGLVKPGGTLVYCTCTVAKEENIDNVRWFTSRFPFTVAPFEMPGGFTRVRWEDDCAQLLPGPRHDAFFIAKLIKSHA